MAGEWRVGCGGAGAPTGPGAELDLRVRPAGGRGPGNVRVGIDGVRRAMLKACPPAVLDLVEVAAYVYAADQAAGRGSPADLGARWRRAFRFRVPVRVPGLWNGPELRSALTTTLGFLSEDDYAFEFVPAPPDPPPGYFTVDDVPFDRPADAVVPFSGGLDSLAGAVEEAVVGGRHAVLVHHRSNPKLQPRVDRLAGEVAARARAAGGRVTFLPVVANKDEGLTAGSTQRARSFLYAALAGAVGVMVGRHALTVYENGVVGLNLPITPAAVGARASRTAHPKVLAGFAAVLSAVADAPFAVVNPFRWDTRADVLRGLAEAGCGDLIARSVSCGGTIGMTAAAPHCGTCSQCVDRRFAVLAAGLGAHDPAAGYRVDVLTGDRADGDPRVVPAAYLDAVGRVEGAADPAAFFALFGEAARALRAGGTAAGPTAELIFRLYRRHADEVLKVLDEAAAERATDLRRGTLPDGCLLRLVWGNDPPRPAGRPPTPAADPPGLVVDPVRFEARWGGETCPLGNGKEFHLLARLARAAGTLVSVRDLGRDVWGDADVSPNTVQRAAARLRKKLRGERLGAVVVDGSVRGHYRLVVPAAAPAAS